MDHDAAMRAHDAAMKVHDAAMKVHDIAMEGHDAAMRVHDVAMMGHYAAKRGHDAAMECHYAGMMGQDVAMMGHYAAMMCHDVAITHNQEHQDPKEDGVGSEVYKLRVRGRDGNEIHFRLKTTTRLGKVKKSYAEQISLPKDSLRFLFDGRWISDDDTPQKLGMKTDDLIEAQNY